MAIFFVQKSLEYVELIYLRYSTEEPLKVNLKRSKRHRRSSRSRAALRVRRPHAQGGLRDGRTRRQRLVIFSKKKTTNKCTFSDIYKQMQIVIACARTHRIINLFDAIVRSKNGGSRRKTESKRARENETYVLKCTDGRRLCPDMITCACPTKKGPIMSISRF